MPPSEGYLIWEECQRAAMAAEDAVFWVRFIGALLAGWSVLAAGFLLWSIRESMATRWRFWRRR